MIFKIRKIEKVKNNYERTRDIYRNFIDIVIGFYIDSHEARRKKGGGETPTYLNELKSWESTYLTANAKKIGNTITSYTENSAINPITHDDLRRCLTGFLNGRQLDGRVSYQFSNLMKRLVSFNAEESETEESRKYDLYESKLGYIFKHFETYVVENFKDLTEERNHTDYIYVYEDGDEGAKPDQGIDANTLGVTEKYNVDSTIHVTRDMYRHFFEGRELQSAKLTICKLYNVYLSYDAGITDKSSRKNPILVHDTINLTDEERSRIDDLIDVEYVNKWSRNMQNDPIYIDLYKLFTEDNIERREVLTKFFIMLVKAEISLRVDSCPYFTNLGIFQVAKVMNVEDFKEIMEGTKISIQEYSDFPLLAHRGIKEVVHEFGATPHKGNFINSMNSRGSEIEQINSNTGIQERIPRSLENYLTKIIQASKDNTNELFKREIVEGINKETITDDDVKKAYGILSQHNKQPEELIDMIKKFHGIYSLLLYNDKRVLHVNEPPKVVYRRLIAKLNDYYTYQKNVYSNRERLDNLWKLIENAGREILLLDDQRGYIPDTDITSNGGKYLHGVEVWETGNYLIPKVEVSTNRMYVVLYNRVILVPNNPLLNEGDFIYEDAPYFVNTKGVKLKVYGEREEDLEQLTREIDMIRGVDTKIASKPLINWLFEAMEEEDISVRIRKRRSANEPSNLNTEDFIEGMTDTDSNIDLLF